MRVLVIGGGGREHAICWAVRKSPRVEQVICAPGNAGIAADALLEQVAADDALGVCELAERLGVDLTVVGPEAPLVAGLADEMRDRGLAVVGHNRSAALLEGSKVFAKRFMSRHGIPTARYEVAESAEAAREIVHGWEYGFPLVVKADGLAAGKGVVIALDVDEAERAIEAMMVQEVLGPAGRRLLIEEALFGREASLIYLTDGQRLVAVPPAQDYKRVGDGDVGPNTGGMGTFSVDGLVSTELQEAVLKQVAMPTVVQMAREGNPLSGILYIGLMLTASGPRVLEYNMRFGDPETQAILMRLDSDIVELFEGVAHGSLAERTAVWSKDAAVCVVLASEGYPGSYAKGRLITGLEQAASLDGVKVFHAGTGTDADGRIVTSGGRVLGVTARAASLEAARAQAYLAASSISFEGKMMRSDIGRSICEG
jgi:phosphoribosylamine--glycine ligase